jgi:hypothetical protein
MITSNFERLLNRQEASDFLNELGYKTAVASLNKLASIGGGPKFRKFGRKPLYAPADLIAWAEARTSPTVRSVTEAEMIRARHSAARDLGEADQHLDNPGTTKTGLRE